MNTMNLIVTAEYAREFPESARKGIAESFTATLKAYGFTEVQITNQEPASDSLILAFDQLHKEMRKLKAELAIRTVLYPYPQESVPARYQRQRSAFEAGYVPGWRGIPYDNPYASGSHRAAYYRGYHLGKNEALAAIEKANR
jgi:hypothetical protein